MRETDWTLRPLDDELGEALRAELLGWPDIKARPMMGCLAFFRKKHFLGAYVNRGLPKKKPDWVNRPDESTFVWVRLRPDDAARAMKVPWLKQSRLEFAGWVEIPLDSRKMLEEAVRWFGRAYERAAAPVEKSATKRRSTRLHKGTRKKK
ncbi:MAG: hypothetical protein M1453_11895 [Acidobacteria bacterium]|nr:hypothetical protein [Acidobacteriota bacterium]MCL5288680.1 hypothetical protein [Acidobacteriota bacterium]